jgi:hypothetical protein
MTMAKISPIPIPDVPPPLLQGKDNSGSNTAPEPSQPAPHRPSIGHGGSGLRGFMHRSGWYESSVAVGTRRFLRGKIFSIAAMLSLFLALFISDLFILAGSTDNTALDVILMIVFLIFGCEFLGLAVTEASYPSSFFFWMDLLGTLSMIFDISFMIGADARQAEKYTGAGAEENIIVVRAARATKLGARAGRLSRVMKLLRFLPFINGGGDSDSDMKMAKVISGQLTNVLSTRVAFLTICIVVVLPIFGMFTYPETDDSMSTWTGLLATNALELYNEYERVPQNATRIFMSRTRLQRELNAFTDFYNDLNYGPFYACFGYRPDDTGYACNDDTYSMSGVKIQVNSSFTEPGRKNFIRIITQDNFMTAFDLSTPKKFESASNGGLIIFIVIVMIVFGLVTSNSITVIALHPLERMLSVVRERCKQIFKYTDELQEDDSDDEEEDYDDDPDRSSEFALLERVVAKLAAIAHLSKQEDEPEVKEGMTEDEMMTLNWMQGAQATAAHKRRCSSMPTSGAAAAESGAQDVDGDIIVARVKSKAENGLTPDILEGLQTSDFNTMELKNGFELRVASYIITSHAGCCDWVGQNIPTENLVKFVTTCHSKYNPNPFHNFSHALDVEYSCARQMRTIDADTFLPDTTQFAVLLAAISHDLGHLGVNNQYLMEISHELALKYNDRSPLENMHCATLFQIVSDPACNVWAQVEKDLYKEMRKVIINAILHTDVIKHNEMMKELVMLYTMDSEAFDMRRTDPDNLEPSAEVLQQHTQLAVNCMVHCSDVGNPMKPWELARRLAYLCVDEFFAQGDLEKEAGIPVQMLNDRDKVNRPNSQIGFIEFVIAPMAEAVVRLFPELDELALNLGTNVKNWFDVWVDQVEPAPEVRGKTEARVLKVAGKCHAVLRENDDDISGVVRLSHRE